MRTRRFPFGPESVTWDLGDSEGWWANDPDDLCRLRAGVADRVERRGTVLDAIAKVELVLSAGQFQRHAARNDDEHFLSIAVSVRIARASARKEVSDIHLQIAQWLL